MLQPHVEATVPNWKPYEIHVAHVSDAARKVFNTGAQRGDVWPPGPTLEWSFTSVVGLNNHPPIYSKYEVTFTLYYLRSEAPSPVVTHASCLFFFFFNPHGNSSSLLGRIPGSQAVGVLRAESAGSKKRAGFSLVPIPNKSRPFFGLGRQTFSLPCSAVSLLGNT